jgi:hypothetical protein
MHFERFEFDIEKREVVEAKVGDEVFAGASVNWRGYSKADSLWMFAEIEGLMASWTDVEADVWSLTGEVDEEGGTVAYSLSFRAGEAWHRVTDWEALDDGRRATILKALGAILDSVHSLLLIF